MNFSKLMLSVTLCLGLCFTACIESESASVGASISANCGCKDTYCPVCGCDDETYLNACTAECAQMDCYIVGACD